MPSAMELSCARHSCFNVRGRSGEHTRPDAEKHTLRSPILLSMPARPVQSVSLQELILQWHEDGVDLQALWGEPHMLCVQIERSQGPQGKSNIRVMFEGMQVWVPGFVGAGLEIQWLHYSVTACVMHRGQSHSSGHYQAVLMQPTVQWLADDGMPPQAYTWNPADERDVSLIWLHKGVDVGTMHSQLMPCEETETHTQATTHNSIASVVTQFFMASREAV